MLGPHKHLVVPVLDDGTLGTPTPLQAQAAGLEGHPWTVRAENAFLPLALPSSGDATAWGDLDAEVRALVEAGVGGLCSDCSDLAAAALGRA